MKKLHAFILLLLFVQQLSAYTFYDQLCNFNFNWEKYAMRSPKGEARQFSSDKEYIQAHLSCVLVILRSNPVDQLNAQQYNSRLHLIKVLDAYRVAGNFPMNYYREERTPVFIDENNTHCAVGYLLQQTGHEDMALRIAAADNYAWLKDIHDAEFPSWQEASGFTVEELKLIQGAYDFYIPNAFILPNKYEIPQKPTCMLAYFENVTLHKPMAAKPENVWCKGEGVNGVLNGRWEQNYSVGMPWIVGYYENGKRSGQWQEYYQGTKQLCRIENWRNDKLNGLRRRFDRYGNIIEEIMFQNGKAVTKTNYSLEDSLTWVRKPLDSTQVWTEVYNFEGSLIASGHEKIYNPGNLLWFQNIELTALNSVSVLARDMSNSTNTNTGSGLIYQQSSPYSHFSGLNLYNSPQLVQYKKEGDWKYFKEYKYTTQKISSSMRAMLQYNYKHFGQSLISSLTLFDDKQIISGYDSIRVEYTNDNLHDFYGYGANLFTHFQISYYTQEEISMSKNGAIYGYRISDQVPVVIKACGQYNQAGEKIGEWKHYTTSGQLYKKEDYLIAWKEEEN